MNERTIYPNETHGPNPGSGIFDDPEEPGGLATVASGVYAENVAVGGLTVRQVRDRYSDRFDLDPNSLAVIDGQDVSDDTVVRTGQVLMFTHRAGEKGRSLSPAA